MYVNTYPELATAAVEGQLPLMARCNIRLCAPSGERVTQQRKRRNCGVARQMARCTKAERVMGELDLAAQGGVRQLDSIQEQLRKCPDAFKPAS